MISNVQRATAAEYSNSSDTDEDSAVEQMNILELKIRSIFAGMAHRVGEENIRCNGDYEEVLANLSKATHESYATADSGADTNVLGKEWRILAIDPVRKVNLVGFDALHARKKGLSIVTVDTILRTDAGEDIMLRAYQSVSNPSTSTALLAENQLRHAGHVVDSVHRDHLLNIDGEKGTQTLCLKWEMEHGSTVYRIPFTQRHGLMTFHHRKPDDLDNVRDLPIIPLTLEVKWDPHSFYVDMIPSFEGGIILRQTVKLGMRVGKLFAATATPAGKVFSP
jgi:hypothetical protein